jgi:hypothetical protein
LESALKKTPPGNDAQVIAFHYVAPMARAAVEFPEVSGQLKDLASAWACGDLHGGAHPGLMAITRGGMTGKKLFADLWHRFVTDTSYTGPRRSLGSIYFTAKAAGWVYGQESQSDD